MHNSDFFMHNSDFFMTSESGHLIFFVSQNSQVTRGSDWHPRAVK